MLVPIWQTLFAAGLLANVDAYGTKREPLYSGMMGFGVWLVLGLGATAVEPVLETQVGAPHAEYAVAVLAVTNAVISLIVGVKAAAGAYTEDSGLSDPTGEYDPTTDTVRR